MMICLCKKYSRKLHWLWVGFLLVSVIFSFRCDLFRGEDSFRFVFMTDIHVQPELRGAEGFESAIDYVNRLNPKPAFILTGGDLIMDALGQTYGRADSLYILFQQNIKKFQLPIYHCIGNHEVFGLYARSGVNPDHPEYGKKMFMNRLVY